MFHIAGGIILAVVFFWIVNAIFDPGPPPMTKREWEEWQEEIERNSW